jgi:nicotinamide phosphoribosyltransferase
MRLSPIQLTDGYKTGHVFQYPKNTTLVYSNWTPRVSRVPGIDKVAFFGLQYFIKEYLQKRFTEDFFNVPVDIILNDYRRRMRGYLGADLNSYEHIESLHKLGYLPIEIKALPEGSLVDMRVPCLTIKNTRPEFYWVTNFIETLMSNILWMPCTSATIAHAYRKILDGYARKTSDSGFLVDYQGHDFSFRGLAGVEAACMSGAGHLLSFKGTDTVPAIAFLEEYYNAPKYDINVGCSVAATEHSVMCAGTKDQELDTYRRLITEVYPSGIVSIVSDQYDLWKVLTDFAVQLKPEIMARNGKVVFRPDSGDPVAILCGDTFGGSHAERMGVIRLLWDKFGGTVNSKGYKELDPHVGAIYGDSITLDRAEEICDQLAEDGFASTNVVFGIGSFTYQYNTRDTFGFAMKSTYVEVDGKPLAIFKDPVTDSGMKKSALGLLLVMTDGDRFTLVENVDREFEKCGDLATVFKNGVLVRDQTYTEIKERLNADKGTPSGN